METTIGSNTFMIGELDAFTQLHVARKLGPAMPLLDGMVKPENASKDLRLLTLLALSQIDDAASDFVVKKCLSVVTMKQESGWAKVINSSGGIMFDTVMTMGVMLELTTQVIEENLGDFFRTALGDLNAGAKEQAG